MLYLEWYRGVENVEVEDVTLVPLKVAKKSDVGGSTRYQTNQFRFRLGLIIATNERGEVSAQKSDRDSLVYWVLKKNFKYSLVCSGDDVCWSVCRVDHFRVSYSPIRELNDPAWEELLINQKLVSVDIKNQNTLTLFAGIYHVESFGDVVDLHNHTLVRIFKSPHKLAL